MTSRPYIRRLFFFFSCHQYLFLLLFYRIAVIELVFELGFNVKFGPTCLPLFSSHRLLVELLMLRKPTKSSCFLEDIRVPFDCKQQINTKHQKQKTSHIMVFKKTSVQSYFRWNPCQTLCKFTESLHLQFLFTLQRLAFMTRHQFFPACLPFVNTVYAGCPKGAMIKNIEIQRPMNNQEKAVSNQKAPSSWETLGTLDPS